MQADKVTYILPIRTAEKVPADGELTTYLALLASMPSLEVIVVDDSAAAVFEHHARIWSHMVRHVAVSDALRTPMGKVGSVLTGLSLASHERVIIADDDVRYSADNITRVATALDTFAVVRPQNYFAPLPWHALWDTGRTLLNRVTGGDWPGTVGVRRSALRSTNGYDGSVMFENLELVRTVVAAGGREAVLHDVFVRRLPSTTRHFVSQRVRQAYDEFARPARLFAQMLIVPVAIALVIEAVRVRSVAPPLMAVALIIAVAELGRQRAHATTVFPFAASLLSPLWVLERGICVWLAVLSHIRYGGIRYRGTLLGKAATPMRVLRARHAHSPRQAAPNLSA